MALEKLVIEASRAKVILLIALCLGFVAVGIWMLLPAEVKTQRTFSSTLFIYGIGLLNVGFFSLGAIAGAWILFSRKPAIELSSDGINIFHIGSSTFISWSEISGFSVCEIHHQKMLAVLLHNSEKHIAACSKLNSYAAKANHNLCGSPIVIAASSLKLSIDELHELCKKYLHQHEARPNQQPSRLQR